MTSRNAIQAKYLHPSSNLNVGSWVDWNHIATIELAGFNNAQNKADALLDIDNNYHSMLWYV